MSHFSDIGVAVQQIALEELSEEARALLAEAEETHQSEEGTLFIFRNVKWYAETNEDIQRLLGELDGADDRSARVWYRIVTVIHDFPTDDGLDAGDWFDNPWELRRLLTVELHYVGEPRNTERCWICRDDTATEHRGVPVCARSSCGLVLGALIDSHDLLVDVSGLRGVPTYRTEPLVEQTRAALPTTFNPEPEEDDD